MKTCQDTMKITNLFCEIDAIPFDENPPLENEFWEPQTITGKRVFAELVAPENRETLRQWYKERREFPMNPVAEQMRRTLEKATGEDFHSISPDTKESNEHSH